MKLGGMDFFHKRWGDLWMAKNCMIMLCNEIVLEMHIFCATSIL